MRPDPLETVTDAVVASLREAGAEPCDGDYQVRCEVTGAPGENLGPGRAAAKANPLVSCLMVTRGDVELMAYAVQCYARQTWPNRELVVVTEPEAAAGVVDYLRSSGAPNCSVTAIASGLALGDLRNIATARARGDVLIQWDDDDLYDPLRIAVSLQVLGKTEAAAAIMARWLIWWPERRLAAISGKRQWEGTMAVWRAHAPIYPGLARDEDSVAVRHLRETRKIAVWDAPLQYLYAIHGQNTWPESHFEGLIAKSERVFEGEAYDALNRILAARMPVLEYEAFLRRR